MFWGFDAAFNVIAENYFCWLGGHYGSGKTMLAHAIAYRLWKQGYVDRIVSNVPCVIADEPFSWEIPDPNQTRTAVVLDEAGLWINNIYDARPYTAFLRKAQIYLLLSSITPPAVFFRTIHIQKVSTLQKFGVPMVRYELTNEDTNMKYRFQYAWDMYGLYKTTAAPTGSEKILQWITSVNDSLAEQDGYKDISQTKVMKKGKSSGLRPPETLSPEPTIPDEMSMAAGALLTASEEMAAAAATARKPPIKPPKKKKRRGGLIGKFLG